MLVLKRYIAFCLVFAFLLFPFKTSALGVSAKSAVLINGADGEVIYAKNADQKMPMASTTKIMTGLLLCEYGNFEREITVTPEMLKVEGSSMGLLAGDRVTLHDLLYGLMLSSGNDAANVIAYTLGGSLDGFVALMNEKAKSLNLKNTSFETPSGLDGDQHYTTAYELAIIAKAAMENEEFAKAVACESATLNYGNPPYRRTLTNHNKMLKMYDGAVGIKTGFTKKSGRCLVSAAERDGKYVIAVTLNAPNDWDDHKIMLDYGFSKIKQTQYSPKSDTYSIPVINGEKDSLIVKIKPFTVSSLATENIDSEIYLPKFLYAPVGENQVVGSIVYKQGDKILGEVEIKTESSISALKNQTNALEIIKNNFKHILDNI